jgi:hypothetical protein
LLGDRRCFFTCHLDLFHALHVRRTRRSGLQHHFRISQDHAEQVVEVVRNPARQPSDRLHLLRKQKLLFQAPRPFLLAVSLPHGQFALHDLALQRFVCRYYFGRAFAYARLQRFLGFAKLVLRHFLQGNIRMALKTSMPLSERNGLKLISTGNSLPSLRRPYHSRPAPIGRSRGESA